jgi:2-polyprenyl-6-methoxyphenol hydroxylase-like FAD-dependent oxidoreductase
VASAAAAAAAPVAGAAAAKARGARDAALERWETSSSPLVHRIQDVSDAVFAESEMAQALREVGVGRGGKERAVE